MSNNIFKNELSRRDAMKTALKGTAYAAPLVLSAAVPAAVSAATPAPGLVPTITGIVPANGPTIGGTVVTLTGTNFCPGATVTVNGVAATNVVVVSSTTITFVTPAGTAGPATVTVTCPAGSPTVGFTYRVCTVTGEAFGLNAVVAPLLALGKVADIVLPPGGTNTVASAGVPILLTTGIITDTSTANGAAASSNAAGTTFTNLVINGTPVTVNPAPNTAITIPGVATVTVNEQIATGNGTTTTGLTVNAVHVVLTAATLGLPVGADIVVASARSGASCV